MDRSAVIGIVIVLVVGAAAWVLTGTAGKKAGAPNGQAVGGGSASGFRERMTQFQEQHKFTRLLTTLVGNIGRLEQEGQHKLTPKQAKQTLDVLQPLRKQPKLTQDEAKETQRALQAILTADQLAEIEKMPERRFGGNQNGGAGGPVGRTPDGQGRQNGGQRRQFDPEAMKNYNPFNPQGGGMGGPRAAARWDEFFTALEAKAKT
ncbi:MAG: hypothetical protein ACYC6A_16350 [Armatimonadota bacterium]